MTLRTDHNIARGIYEQYGLEQLQKYQKLPFLDLTTIVDDDREFDGTSSRSVHFHVEHLPFDKAIYYLHFNAVNAATEEKTPIEVAVISRLADSPTTSASTFVSSIVYKAADAPRIRSQDVVLTSTNDDWTALTPCSLCSKTHTFVRSASYDECPQGISIFICQQIAYVVLEIIEFLTQKPDYFVQVVPPAPSPRQLKTARLKPWLREDLPSVIMLHPDDARNFGHPSADRGGIHASPHPHQRRGHWATLRAERYKAARGTQVWRRPTWIGDQEWIFQGNRYSIISTENDKT